MTGDVVMVDGVTDTDGLVTRRMSAREHMTWNSALRIARHMGVDDAADELARRANNLEASSDRYTFRGLHVDAADTLRAAELLDHAARVLL